MTIREATKEDFDAIWPIFYEIVKAGETYDLVTSPELVNTKREM